jgi:hypothetical protein
MRRFVWILSVFLILAFQLPASTCVAGGTLASYEALGATGCTVGPQTVSDFTFSVISSGGGATPATDTDITVTPTSGLNFYGVQFAAADFSVTGTGFVNYLIGFTWDSLPIAGMGDVLDPGTVNIPTDGCVGAAFSGSSCSGTSVSVTVDLSQLTDSVFFPATATLGIANSISLNANGGTASFTSLENDAYVLPEPMSLFLVPLGLTILAARVLPRQTLQVRFHCVSKYRRSAFRQ